MTDTASTPVARIAFSVVNVPLRQPLAIDAFVLTPIDEIADVLKRLKRFAAESEVTATGTFALPPLASLDQAYDTFWAPSRALTLLLSFANRCHVQVVEPTLEIHVDGQWVEQGWHAYLFREGHASGASWYIGQRDLEDFLQRSFSKLNDPTFAEETGLRLALEFYDQALCELVGEMQYLKTWIALEILVGHAEEAEVKIVSDNRFKKLRSALKRSLTEALSAGKLQEAEYEAMTDKLPELNRPSTRRQVVAFCERIFEAYPAQDVTDEEIQRFLHIRNAITHGGVMQPVEDEDYATVLNHEQGRLRSLLERVVLALLEDRPNLMEFSWRHYFAAR